MWSTCGDTLRALPLCHKRQTSQSEPEPSGDGARLQNGSVRFDFGRALHAFVAQWKCRLFLPARSGVQISPKAPTSSSRWLRVSVSDADAPCSIHGEETVSPLRRGGTTLESTKLVVLVQLQAEGLYRGYLAAQGTISYVVVRQFDPATRDSFPVRPRAGRGALTSRMGVRIAHRELYASVDQRQESPRLERGQYRFESDRWYEERTWRNGSRARFRT